MNESINEYTVNQMFTLLGNLFLKNDLIYIQSYDPVNGRPQKVFNNKRVFLGEITSKKYWSIEKSLTSNPK
jgi:hypothetical protein